MDRVALVGLPPAALGPQDIPHRRVSRTEMAGAPNSYIKITMTDKYKIIKYS